MQCFSENTRLYCRNSRNSCTLKTTSADQPELLAIFDELFPLPAEHDIDVFA